jgi:hypothetical protein
MSRNVNTLDGARITNRGWVFPLSQLLQKTLRPALPASADFRRASSRNRLRMNLRGDTAAASVRRRNDHYFYPLPAGAFSSFA